MESGEKPQTDQPNDQADSIELALNFALLAPSPRNIQPWAFSANASDGVVNMSFDRSRSRPIGDPYDRELTISCGVALAFLGLALESLGAAHVVTMYPDPNEPDFLAKIRLTGDATESAVRAQMLVEAAVARRTMWRRLLPDPLPQVDLDMLAEVAALEGAQLRVVTEMERPAIDLLVAEADELQQADPKFVAELKRWPTGRPSAAKAGPDSADSVGDEPSTIAPDAGSASAPTGVMIALSTFGDTEDEWLLVGRALAGVLLTATGLGYSVTFVNQPIQIPSTRGEVGTILGIDADIQQLLLVGFADEIAPATPRRSLDEASAPLTEPW